MTSELSPNKKYIIEILDKHQLLIKSDLNRLSLINSDELAFLEQRWPFADVKRRRKIIENLVKLGYDNATLNFGRIFSFCLDDNDAQIRIRAIEGLAEDEDTSIISSLKGMLHDDDSFEVRDAAAAALGKFAVLGELGKISNRKIDDVFNGLLTVIEKQHELAKVKSSALEAIAAFNVPRVRNLIEESYYSDDLALKTSAIKAMGVNCNLEWLELLEKELNSDDSEIRYTAVKSIGELGSEDAIPYLLEIIDDEDIRIQEAVIKAMGEIGGEEARRILNSLLLDPEQHIRQAAKSALKEIDFCEDPLSSSS
jgi:HEAT repeat protein